MKYRCNYDLPPFRKGMEFDIEKDHDTLVTLDTGDIVQVPIEYIMANRSHFTLLGSGDA